MLRENLKNNWGFCSTFDNDHYGQFFHHFAKYRFSSYDWEMDRQLCARFFILSGFYLLIMILAYFFRNNIKDAITDKAIEAFFND
jgi:hypothetical protein